MYKKILAKITKILKDPKPPLLKTQVVIIGIVFMYFALRDIHFPPDFDLDF